MSETIAKKQRQAAYKMVLVQLALSVVLGIVGFLFSAKIALSLFVGAIIVVIANFIFATIVFRKSGAQAAEQVKKGFAIGESIKFLLIVVLLIVAYTLLPVMPDKLLIGFCVLVISQWFTPFVFKTSL